MHVTRDSQQWERRRAPSVYVRTALLYTVSRIHDQSHSWYSCTVALLVQLYRPLRINLRAYQLIATALLWPCAPRSRLPPAGLSAPNGTTMLLRLPALKTVQYEIESSRALLSRRGRNEACAAERAPQGGLPSRGDETVGTRSRAHAPCSAAGEEMRPVPRSVRHKAASLVGETCGTHASWSVPDALESALLVACRASP